MALHVSEHPDGYLVRVRRGGHVHQAFVSGHSTKAQREAARKAAELRRLHPLQPAPLKRDAVSESADRFQVSYVDEHGQRRNKTFHFNRSTKAAVRAKALAFRRAYERRARGSGA